MDRQGSLESALRRRQRLCCRARPVRGAARAGLAAIACPATGAGGVGFARRPKPIERRPYRISLHIGFDPSARIDEAKRADLIREWQVLVRRFIGAPWVVTIADPSSPLANFELDALEPDAFASVASFDKVWVVRIARSELGLGARLHGSRVRHGHAAARAASASARARACRMPLGPCSSSRAICSTRPR